MKLYCHRFHQSSLFNPICHLEIFEHNNGNSFLGSPASPQYLSNSLCLRAESFKRSKMDFAVYADVQPGPPVPSSQTSSNPWNNWILGTLFSIIIPLLTHKSDFLSKLPKKIDTVVETAEEIVESVETVAEEVENVAEMVEDDFPESEMLTNVATFVEKVAEEIAKDAQLADEFIDEAKSVKTKASQSLHTIPHVSGSKQKCDDVSDPSVYAQVYKRRDGSESADEARDIHERLVDDASQPTPDGIPRQPGEVLVQVLDVLKNGGYVRGLENGGLGFAPCWTSSTETYSAVQRENEEIRQLVLQMQQKEDKWERREAEREQWEDKWERREAERERLQAKWERREAEREQRLQQIEDLLQTQRHMPSQDPPSSNECLKKWKKWWSHCLKQQLMKLKKFPMKKRFRNIDKPDLPP